jgi:hypothetical protein
LRGKSITGPAANPVAPEFPTEFFTVGNNSSNDIIRPDYSGNITPLNTGYNREFINVEIDKFGRFNAHKKVILLHPLREYIYNPKTN